jgi:RNA polymerase sigma-70 factor (ECF subfamily)
MPRRTAPNFSSETAEESSLILLLSIGGGDSSRPPDAKGVLGLSLPDHDPPRPEQEDVQRAALRSYFRKRVPPNDVEDLIQEVFVGLYSRRSAEPIENPEGYLFTVASNTLLRKRRTDARRWAAADELSNLSWVEAITPERILAGRERLDAAMLALRALPDRTRHVFLLHRFEDMTYRAIASQIGISVSAVEKHMMNALRALGAAMEGER